MPDVFKMLILAQVRVLPQKQKYTNETNQKYNFCESSKAPAVFALRSSPTLRA
jgi:hypothetical protein